MELLTEIEKSFPRMEKLFDEKGLSQLWQGEYHMVSSYHYGLGLWIRNELLKEETVLYRLFRQAGLRQKDDMSDLMLQLFYLWAKTNESARLY